MTQKPSSRQLVPCLQKKPPIPNPPSVRILESKLPFTCIAHLHARCGALLGNVTAQRRLQEHEKSIMQFHGVALFPKALVEPLVFDLSQRTEDRGEQRFKHEYPLRCWTRAESASVNRLHAPKSCMYVLRTRAITVDTWATCIRHQQPPYTRLQQPHSKGSRADVFRMAEENHDGIAVHSKKFFLHIEESLCTCRKGAYCAHASWPGHVFVCS